MAQIKRGDKVRLTESASLQFPSFRHRVGEVVGKSHAFECVTVKWEHRKCREAWNVKHLERPPDMATKTVGTQTD